MNHQPFRDWLLSEEDLSAEQTQALQKHLATCESCTQFKSSVKELDGLFRNSPQVGPKAGFSQRWQSHLIENQVLQQRRRGWFTIAITAVIALVLLAVSITQVWQLIQAPGPYVQVWLDRLISVVSLYFLVDNVIGSISWSTPFFTFIAMFFMLGMVSFMSVLWLAAYKKFSLARRVI
jgi:uncharacterized membrane protein